MTHIGTDRRSGLGMVVAVVALLAVTAPAAHADPVAFATDPCSTDPSPRTGVLAYQDVCQATIDTVSSGEDIDTTLSLALTLAGDAETRTPSSYSVGWSAGDCTFAFHASDATLDEPDGASVLFVHCGDYEKACTELPTGSTLNCDSTWDHEATYAVPAPSYEGRQVTWSVTFADDLAAYATLHAHEATITPGWAVVGSSALIHEGQLFLMGCNSDVGCVEPAGDWAFGSGIPYTIG
jgi:hypothetical protein